MQITDKSKHLAHNDNDNNNNNNNNNTIKNDDDNTIYSNHVHADIYFEG